MIKTTNLLALAALSVVFTMLASSAQADAMIFVKIPGVPGDSSITVDGYDSGEWFVADSFSFGIEREMKESGEKGGTADINIGVGELQECTISKSMDSASASLAQFAINGNSPGTAEIDFVEVAGGGEEGEEGTPILYLKYKLDRVTIKSWSISAETDTGEGDAGTASTSGDADDRPTEEVAFYYNKIAFAHNPNDGTEKSPEQTASWDVRKKTTWDAVIDALLDAVFPDDEEPPRG